MRTRVALSFSQSLSESILIPYRSSYKSCRPDFQVFSAQSSSSFGMDDSYKTSFVCGIIFGLCTISLAGAFSNEPHRRLHDAIYHRPREPNNSPTYKSKLQAPSNANDPKNDYIVIYPYTSPHNRGGKSLNFTLSPGPAQTQSRIINNPDHYGHRNEIPLDSPNYHYGPSGIPNNSEPVVHDDQPCVCVPQYLCKNGFVASGGLVAGSLKRRKTLFKNVQNETESLISKPEKVVHLVAAQTTNNCGSSATCCRLPESNVIPEWDDYPVATPPPDTYYPFYPDDGQQEVTCGVRHAYGLHGRVQNIEYPVDVAEYGEFPWQVAVLKKVVGDQSLYLCGGVLISPQWVATAAHCFKHSGSSELQVRLGEWDVYRGDEIYPLVDVDVDAVVIHPHFSTSNLHNDLALVRIREVFDSQFPHITPACLPDGRHSFTGQKCWVSGWGKDAFGPRGQYQNVLKKVDVPLLARSLCENKLRDTQLGSYFRLHPGFICAGGEPGKDACTGDGGSPLVCEIGGLWYVAGLVSWGIGCGQAGVPGVYVNIAYYLDWIDSIILR